MDAAETGFSSDTSGDTVNKKASFLSPNSGKLNTFLKQWISTLVKTYSWQKTTSTTTTTGTVATTTTTTTTARRRTTTTTTTVVQTYSWLARWDDVNEAKLKVVIRPTGVVQYWRQPFGGLKIYKVNDLTTS